MTGKHRGPYRGRHRSDVVAGWRRADTHARSTDTADTVVLPAVPAPSREDSQ